MDAFFKYVLGELGVIVGAPVTFAIALLVVGGIVWWALDWRYAALLANRDSEIVLVKSQRDDYKDKLGGATPDQAKAKMAALEEKVQRTIGNSWTPLTPNQADRLRTLVADLPKRKIQVMYSNYLGKDLAKSISDAMFKGGWTDMHFSEGSGLGDGLSTGPGNGMALQLKAAIENATNFKVESIRPNEKDHPGIVFVAVGINAH